MKPECLECEATLTLALERVKRLEEALRLVLPLAEDWLAEMRIEKRDSERQGFSSSEMDDTEDNATRAIIDAHAALRPEGT